MKIRSFEFNVKELAGSMGNFGTLFPLAAWYVTRKQVLEQPLTILYTGKRLLVPGWFIMMADQERRS